MDSPLKGFWILATVVLLAACEPYLEVDLPTDQVVGEVVFENPANVEAAFADIYIDLRESAFTTGLGNGLSNLMGLYADELALLGAGQEGGHAFYDNSLLATGSSGQRLWNTSYSLIYKANGILEGVRTSKGLSQEEKERFEGEAYFIRAFVHFYLNQLFGEVPYIESTDYRVNQEVHRDDSATINQKMVADLTKARELLPEGVSDGMHFRPDRWVASSLLSRVYLYQGNWQLALDEAEHLILDSGYRLEQELDQVFRGGSSETLWQLDTESNGINTREAYSFIIISAPPSGSFLSSSLLDAFEEGDLRRVQWVGEISGATQTWYFPFKYRLNTVTPSTEEYSILFRLTEQYLIAAEAKAQLGQMVEALDYLNAVRARAGLNPVAIGEKEMVLEAVSQERRIEFFAEQGHRFFDLKRSGRIDEVLNNSKPQWDPTDTLLPIPETELINNPNLLPQNEGY